MPFLQKTHGYNKPRSKGRTSTLLYGKRTPLPIKVFIIALYTSLFIFTIVILFVEPWVGDTEGCKAEGVAEKTYANPDYVNSACLWER
jgi:hypothetical protein